MNNSLCLIFLAWITVSTRAHAQDAKLQIASHGGAFWPQFRGPAGRAVAAEGHKYPVEFGPEKNLRWKSALPYGLSSPIVWGERVFLTGFDAQAKKLETLCLDRHTGKILWRRPAPAEKIESVYKINSPASSTPCTDGERVYAAFGSYGLLAYDFDGNELWKLPLPTPRTSFGSGTSPILVGGVLLLNGQGKDAHVLAVDAKTGKTLWRTETSPFPSDYPVPLVWKNGDKSEVIVLGKGGIMAYDLAGGAKRWWLPGLALEANTSPTSGEGAIYVASHLPGGDPDLRMTLPPFEELLDKHDKNKDGKLGRAELPTDLIIFKRGGKEGVGEIHLHHMTWLFDKNRDGFLDDAEWTSMQKTPFDNALLAIRPGGTGDVAQTHVLWQHKRGIPEVPSPLFYQGRIYMVRNGGVLTCLDAQTGKAVYPQQRLNPGGIFYASPVAGDGKVYCCSDSGLISVLKAADRFEVLAENDLGETIRATPALVGGWLYVRTAECLYAFNVD
ncbi:MAG: PQQ-binding-like beta-propeller repeat protein [Gemmataceae bacterium]|nr:PQQ-binding-like beta-propeller repeat protein [Gemmataceae bacterium]MCI0740527.1 PQQ-binding-like beta-propeller repeat protein [Gemmataceae bacterium]